jgi:hypothetical protein
VHALEHRLEAVSFTRHAAEDAERFGRPHVLGRAGDDLSVSCGEVCARVFEFGRLGDHALEHLVRDL